MWNLGYADGKSMKPSRFERGPVAIIGVAAFDYCQGYAAANSDRIWANNNRPPAQ